VGSRGKAEEKCEIGVQVLMLSCTKCRI